MVRIAEFLSRRNEVTVLTSLPSYPTGILPPSYRGKIFTKEKDGKVTILRVWDLPTPNKGFVRRTLNHLVFAFTATIAALSAKPFDIVIVSSPNFFSGISGILAAKIGKGKFIFDVRDLWPDSAFELGYKTNKVLKKILKAVEKYYYNTASKIFCATEEIRNTIVRAGIQENKVITLLNTVDINVFKPMKVSRSKFNLNENDFVIIYVGSLTQVQNLKTVIEAAEMLKKQLNIKFIMVGEGEDKENLIAQVEKLKLQNISFIDGQPTEKIVEMINVADLGLISLSKNKFFSDNALPTKTSEYLGCGKPIVACAGKNLKELIEKNKVGIVVPPGDSKALAKAILELYKNPELTKKISLNARKLVVEHFSDENFYQVLEKNLF